MEKLYHEQDSQKIIAQQFSDFGRLVVLMDKKFTAKPRLFPVVDSVFKKPSFTEQMPSGEPFQRWRGKNDVSERAKIPPPKKKVHRLNIFKSKLQKEKKGIDKYEDNLEGHFQRRHPIVGLLFIGGGGVIIHCHHSPVVYMHFYFAYIITFINGENC